MSRTIATVKRPSPHDFEADCALAGQYCKCGLAATNNVHDPKVIAGHRAELAATAAAQEHQRRWTGEHD